MHRALDSTRTFASDTAAPAIEAASVRLRSVAALFPTVAASVPPLVLRHRAIVSAVLIVAVVVGAILAKLLSGSSKAATQPSPPPSRGLSFGSQKSKGSGTVTIKPKSPPAPKESDGDSLVSFVEALGRATADAAVSTAEAVLDAAKETQSAPAAGDVPVAGATAASMPPKTDEQWQVAMKTMAEMKVVIRDQVIMLDRLKSRLDEAKAENTQLTAELRALKDSPR